MFSLQRSVLVGVIRGETMPTCVGCLRATSRRCHALVQASWRWALCAGSTTIDELIYLRVSNQHGCAFCRASHGKRMTRRRHSFLEHAANGAVILMNAGGAAWAGDDDRYENHAEDEVRAFGAAESATAPRADRLFCQDVTLDAEYYFRQHKTPTPIDHSSWQYNRSKTTASCGDSFQLRSYLCIVKNNPLPSHRRFIIFKRLTA